MIAAVGALGVALAPSIVTAFFCEHVNRATLRLLFYLTMVLIIGSALVAFGTFARRGATPAVLCMVGLESVAAGALLCVDVHMTAAQVNPPNRRPQVVSLPLRALFASTLALGSTLLALYHLGSLERVAPQASDMIEALTPSSFDPLLLLRKPRPRDCVLGAEQPTFTKDRIVSCHSPHDWQVLSRLEPFENCPDAATLTAGGVQVAVLVHDLPYDRWCLARSSIGDPLTAPVCTKGLACTE